MKNLRSVLVCLEYKVQMAEQSEQRFEWEEVHMGIALVASQRSPDLDMKVGACVVDVDNKVIGVGYNGSSIGTKLYDFGDKHDAVVHAEVNAILHSSGNLKGGTIYTTLHPCFQCAKAIVQSKIEKVVFLEMKDSDKLKIPIAKQILAKGKVEIKAYHRMMKETPNKSFTEELSYSDKVKLKFFPSNFVKVVGKDEYVRERQAD